MNVKTKTRKPAVRRIVVRIPVWNEARSADRNQYAERISSGGYLTLRAPGAA